MKKIFGMLMIISAMVMVSRAQKLSEEKVPAPVLAAFIKLHPNVKAKWEKEKLNFEAGFKLNDRLLSEVYTPDGKLLETEMEIKSSELPAAVLSKLKGLKVTETAKITRADGSVVYEAEVKGKDLLFDVNGKKIVN